jgi:arylsulfatase A-like enzyme
MKHRVIAVALLITTSALGGSDRRGAASGGAHAQARPPNIVVIVADDMGYADIGVHGSKDIPTPNIDALAAGGIRFTDAYVSGPYCGPTRAGLLTGRYPQRFGQEFNLALIAAHREVGLPIEERTLADHLKAVGYRTALFGKWHLGTAPKFFPMRRGFDEFFGFLAGGHPYMSVGTQANPIYDGETVATSITYLTDTLSSRAVEFVQRNRARPFFMYLAFNAVHAPLQATDKYLSRVANIADPTRRTYAAMLSAMDDGIGRTLAALRANNLEENTLVFFFSDNGGPLREEVWNGSSNTPLRGYKAQTWEGGIRVPFIIRWKGKLPEGTTDSRPIIQLDVLPTALAAAGVALKPEWRLDGVNLMPFLTNATTGAPHDALFWRMGGIMAIRKGDWKLVKMHEGGNTEDPAKLTLQGAQLFNLRTDMSEKTNLAAAEPEKLRDLSATWLRWRDQLRAPIWPPAQGYRGDRSCLDATIARPVEAYAGTWRGTLANVIEFTWEQRTDGSGSIRMGTNTTAIPTRLVHASVDSLVADVTEPTNNGRPGAETVRLKLAATVCGDRMGGIALVLRPNGAIARNMINATRSR